MKFITKALFKYFKRCPRLLALAVKSPEHRSPDGERLARHLAEQGIRVGQIAQEQYKAKGAVEIITTPFDKAIDKTKAAIRRGLVVIEGSFAGDNTFARTDILNSPANELIEIKSCTKVKDDHPQDTGFQLHVLRSAGIAIKKVLLGLINKDFHLKSEKTPLTDLIKFVDITEEAVAVADQAPEDIKAITKILNSPRIPRRDIGQHCYSPIPCPFLDYCHKDIANHTVLDLRRDYKKKFELHKTGVHHLAEIPDFVTLTDFQQKQKEAEATGAAAINKSRIQDYIKQLKYPIYFLDFEAFMEAVPRYAGTKPYQQIPFQASVHILRSEDAEIEHYSFLHTEDTDPSLALAQFLAKTIGNTGSIIAYHASYERARIEELTAKSNRYHHVLKSMLDRLWDLEEPFSHGWYVDQRFRGSTSIKEVLPVLVPELSYKSLKIQNGSEAYLQYLEMIAPDTRASRKAEIKSALEAYCALDTLALVKILSVLKEVVK